MFSGSRHPIPPEELSEVYGRIDDETSLVDEVDGEEFDEPLDGDVDEPNHISNYLDNYTDESHRRRLSDYARDEQRLKSVTARDAPVFSKAKVGIRGGLSAGNLQRRDRESQPLSEEGEDGGFEPPVNIPSNWSSRSNNLHRWNRENEIGSQDEEPEYDPLRETRREINLNTKTRRTSDHLRRREKTNGLVNGTHSEPENDLGGDDVSKDLFSIQDQKLTEETPVFDVPVTIYKSSTFNKPSPRKRDSQDLLRRLARAESPGQLKTPEPQKPPGPRIYDKTPVVTGAYIDTPMTERAAEPPEDSLKAIIKSDEEPQEPSQRSESQVDLKPILEVQSTKDRAKPPLKRPKLPKSGLEAIIEDSKSGDLSDPLGDSTIESLEGLKESNQHKTAEGEEESSDDAYLKAVEEDLAREAKKPEREPNAELEELKAQRQALLDRIAQIEKDPSSLEKRPLLDEKEPSLSSDEAEGKEHIQTKPTCYPVQRCEKCGAYNDGRIYIAVPVPRLWRRDPVSRRIRLTPLGWYTLLFIFWFCSESTMCDYYCHPLIAEVCEGNCLMSNAPKFPFVIPTMLWRWLHLESIFTPILAITVAFFRLILQVLGFWDGFVDEPHSTHLNLPTDLKTAIHGSSVTNIPVPGISTTPNVVVSQTATSQEPWPGYDEISFKLQESRDFQRGNMRWDDSMEDDEYI